MDGTNKQFLKKTVEDTKLQDVILYPEPPIFSINMKISKKMEIGKIKFLTEHTEDTEDFLKEEESSH